MTHGPGRARWRQPGVFWLSCLCLGLLASAASGAPVAGASARSCKPVPPVQIELIAGVAAPGTILPLEVRIRADRPVEDLKLELSTPGGRGSKLTRQVLADRLDARGEISRKLSVMLPSRGVAEIFASVKFRLPGGGHLSRAAYLQFQDGLPATRAPLRLARSGAETVAEYPAGGVR